MSLSALQEAFPFSQLSHAPPIPYFTPDKVTMVALLALAAAAVLFATGVGLVALQVTHVMSWWLVLGGAVQIIMGIWLGLASSWLYDGATELQGSSSIQKGETFENLGNTCFINAVIRAICNDGEMKRVFKEVCKLEIRRHKAALGLQPTEETLIVLARTPCNFVGYPIIDGYVKKYKAHQNPTFAGSDQEALASELRHINSPADLDPPSLPAPPLPAARGEPSQSTSILQTHLGDVRNRLAGYEAFLKFLETGRASPEVRYLLAGNTSPSQEDSEDFLRGITRDMDLKDYPTLCFEQSAEKKWVKCSEEIQQRAKARLENAQRLADPSGLRAFPTGVICERVFEFNINLPIHENTTGQALLNGYVNWHDSGSEAAWFRDAHDNIDLYQMQERYSFSRPPEKLMICLKRYAFNASDQTQHKLDYDIPMDEEIEVQGQKYRLRSVVIHSGGVGGGHYTTVMRKADRWEIANDREKKRATEDQKAHALKQGYIYFYEKVPAVSASAVPAAIVSTSP